MGIDRHCRWVRHRLPLLVGGELAIDDRRKVERHLIGCFDCRDRQEASAVALSALRAVAEVAPARIDAPPLWPALSAQIRQSRHASPRSPWWETVWPRAWAPLGLALAALGLVSGPLAWLVSREPAGASSSPPVPSVTVEAPPAGASKLAAASSAISPKSPTVAADGPSRTLVNPGFDPTSTAGLQVNYDLDHGTPVPQGLGNRDPQHSY